MNKNLGNICRVCLSSASRNIFEKSTASQNDFSIPAIGENVSSLDRLVEKLRYVTMLKVDECENLPKNMCDSCIIQLNVAYNLKKNAIQSDLKLRQYMIEFGINVTSYTTCSINTVSVIRPPAMILPANTTSESVTITTAKSTIVEPPSAQPPPQLQPQLHRPFPVMPIIIKEEPEDYDEIMSDITVGTNNEAFIEQVRNRQNERNGSRSTPGTSTNSSCNKSITPLPLHSMVALNNKSLLGSSSDSEFISAYVKNASSVAKKLKKTRQSKSPNKQKSVETVATTTPPAPAPEPVPAPKSKNQSAASNSSQNGENKTPAKRARRKEIDALTEDSHIQKIDVDSSAKRKTRQQLSNANNIENSKHASRSRSGTKSDYTSFFSIRPKLTNRRKSFDQSTKSNGRSSNAKTPTRSAKAANLRKRRDSRTHNRTSI
ncbi:uncharacterized protein LOC116347082 [Contarinia nasturtii]|uniref:uncharacterized protein LOC116347082 n=1 Tax=Contarinia nasturtii TaxID=265458 RepID=UPI0012D48473|nr:uncharacterized protein LOC116347082 [Contarinia nasturtii]